MYSTDKSILIVIPKSPFRDWVIAAMAVEKVEERLFSDSNVYLVTSLEEDDDEQKYLDTHYSRIFENELASWLALPSAWPKERTRKVFDEWFDVQFLTCVYSIDPTPIKFTDLKQS